LTVRSETSPRTFIEQARRAQILAAAIDVLAGRGYGAASLAAIAEHISVSKGVISYYFAGKDGLLREVVASVLTEAAAYMRPRVESAPPGRAALRAYVTANLEFIDTHRREILALIEIFNGASPGRSVAPPYAEGHRAAVDAVTRILEQGQQAGEFGAFHARFAAMALRAAIDAVAELLRADTEADVLEYGAELARLFEKGLQA
jgi:AcrR family transcriptional regulator